MTSALILGLLAQDSPRDTGPDFGKASPFGLLIVVLLLVATFALIWSMNRHLRRVPASFETETESADPDEDAEHDAIVDPETPAEETKREPGG
jgi:hypothetical protein